MRVSECQQVLAFTGYYKSGIDGDLGPATKKAIQVIERTQAKQYRVSPSRWGWTRRLIAATQAALNALKHNAGGVDGLSGHNTKEAYRAFVYERLNGKKERVKRPAAKGYTPQARDIPRQRECKAYYGATRAQIERQLVTIELPFRLRIDFNLRQTTNKIRVHRKAAPSLKAALIAVHAHYGIARMRKLGIDRFAGSYVWRTMRGGTKLSMHAYGCAVDFYASPNGLRVSCPKALFCRAEYKAFLDIMEKHGWLPAVRLWGKDAMHFQRARM